MPRDIFELLLRCWHFCNNDLVPNDDRLFELKVIWNALIYRFQTLHSPTRKVSIDECMVL